MRKPPVYHELDNLILDFQVVTRLGQDRRAIQDELDF